MDGVNSPTGSETENSEDRLPLSELAMRIKLAEIQCADRERARQWEERKWAHEANMRATGQSTGQGILMSDVRDRNCKTFRVPPPTVNADPEISTILKGVEDELKMKREEAEREKKRAQYKNEFVEQEKECLEKQRILKRERLLKAALLAETHRKSGRGSDKNFIAVEEKVSEEFWNAYRIICEEETCMELQEITHQSSGGSNLETKFSVESREVVVSVSTILAGDKSRRRPVINDMPIAETVVVKAECDEGKKRDSGNAKRDDHTEIAGEQLQDSEGGEIVVDIVSYSSLDEERPEASFESMYSVSNVNSVLVEDEKTFVGEIELRLDSKVNAIGESTEGKFKDESNLAFVGEDEYSCEVEINMIGVKQSSPKSGNDFRRGKNFEECATKGVRFPSMNSVECSRVGDRSLLNDNGPFVRFCRVNSEKCSISDINKKLFAAGKREKGEYTCSVENMYIYINSNNMCKPGGFTSNFSNWKYKRKWAMDNIEWVFSLMVANFGMCIFR